MRKCDVCGKEFDLKVEDKYVARDDRKSGMAAALSGKEETLYDAFDCPFCGCQNVIQERKRVYVDEAEMVEIDEKI